MCWTNEEQLKKHVTIKFNHVLLFCYVVVCVTLTTLILFLYLFEDNLWSRDYMVLMTAINIYFWPDSCFYSAGYTMLVRLSYISTSFMFWRHLLAEFSKSHWTNHGQKANKPIITGEWPWTKFLCSNYKINRWFCVILKHALTLTVVCSIFVFNTNKS